MATTEARTERTPFLVHLLIVTLAIVMIVAGAINIYSYFGAPLPLALPPALPTAAVRMQPTPAPRVQEAAPVAAPLPGIAQNAAEADALYNAAVLAGEQRAGTDPAPAILVTKPSQREGAGENVPTAEPVVVVTDWFGSKQAPVNIQATHECKHGQVWIDGKGCKNP